MFKQHITRQKSNPIKRKSFKPCKMKCFEHWLVPSLKRLSEIGNLNTMAKLWTHFIDEFGHNEPRVYWRVQRDWIRLTFTRKHKIVDYWHRLLNFCHHRSPNLTFQQHAKYLPPVIRHNNISIRSRRRDVGSVNLCKPPLSKLLY